jgi:hypothetical protein
MNDNIVVFPLRGRRLMAALAKAIKVAGRPMSASELADAVGEPCSIIYEALDSYGAQHGFWKQQA